MKNGSGNMDSLGVADRSWILRNRGLFTILLAGAVVRVLLVWWFQGEPIYVDDAQDYNALAVRLVEHGEFRDAAGNLTSLRPPLYPAFLASVYRVCGVENYTAVRVVQSILGLLLAVVVYALAREMFGRRTAILAAAMCCFYPSLLGFGNMLLTETLFSVLVCLACLMLLYYLRHQSIGWGVLAGVFLGLGALTRSILWPFTPFLALYLVFALDASHWTKRIALAAVPTVALLATITPWAIRNTRVHDTFVVVDVMGGRNFMMGNYEYTPPHRAWDAISVGGEKAWHRILAKEVPTFARMTQGQRDKVAFERGVEFVLNNPLLTATRCLTKFFNFWQLERSLIAGMSRGWWGGLPAAATAVFAVLIVGYYASALLAGIFGFMMCDPSDKRMHWYILLLIGFICAVHTVIFGHSRYHVPIMPLIIVYASHAAVHARSMWHRRRQWQFWLAATISGALVASWIWEAVAVDLDRIWTSML